MSMWPVWVARTDLPVESMYIKIEREYQRLSAVLQRATLLRQKRKYLEIETPFAEQVKILRDLSMSRRDGSKESADIERAIDVLKCAVGKARSSAMEPAITVMLERELLYLEALLLEAKK